MKGQLATIFLLLYLLLSIQPTYAQTVATPTADISRLQLLEQKVDLLEHTNAEILNTVYWALGGLISVFLAIIGLNFFQNFSLNKREIDGIREDVKKEIKIAKNTLLEENKRTSDLVNENVISKVKIEVEASFSQLKSQLTEVEETFQKLKRENLLRGAFEYKQKRQMGWLLNLIEVLNDDIKKGWEFRINETLDLIAECLDDLKPNANSLTKLQISLNSLPKEYSLQKKRIESKMKL